MAPAKVKAPAATDGEEAASTPKPKAEPKARAKKADTLKPMPTAKRAKSDETPPNTNPLKAMWRAGSLAESAMKGLVAKQVANLSTESFAGGHVRA